MKQQLGFTLLELLISILIMTVLASTAILSPKIFSQTAKREAERISNYINRQMSRADIIHQEFILTFEHANKPISSFGVLFPYYPNARKANKLPVVKIDDKEYTYEEFKLKSSCKIESPFTQLKYDFQTNEFNLPKDNFAGITYGGGGTVFILTDEFGGIYYIKIEEGMISTKAPKK